VAQHAAAFYWHVLVLEQRYSARLMMQAALVLRSWAALLFISNRPGGMLTLSRAAQIIEVILHRSSLALPFVSKGNMIPGPTAMVMKRLNEVTNDAPLGGISSSTSASSAPTTSAPRSKLMRSLSLFFFPLELLVDEFLFYFW